MVQFPRWQMVVVLLVVLAGIVFSTPNLLQRETAEGLPDWMPSQQINLGLDLQGGIYLLSEIGIDAVMQKRLDDDVDAVRSTLREMRTGYTGLGTQDGGVIFTLKDPSKSEEVRDRLLADLGGQLITTEDDGGFRIEMDVQQVREFKENLIRQTMEIIRIRLDELGTREPSVQRQGEDRILIQVPGEKDPERLKDILQATAVLTFHAVDEDIVPGRDRIPAGSRVLEEKLAEGAETTREPQLYVVRKRVVVSGENLVDAQATFQEGQPVVSFRFDSLGAKKFGRHTSDNVGRIFAIVLDDKVISAPVVREPILGGSGVISGAFTVKEVQDLALLLRAGALPAPLTYLEERTVGAGLGADTIAAGKIASVLGLVAVIVFMVAVYGLFGLLASTALLVNLVLIMAGLSGLQATLTLPGIAGIVLTIGMAVDANVLIFERIREEARAGRGPVTAIDAGYRRAMTTIIDSNLTTLIAAILLFSFGTGPIKGFAVTLAIGLVTSMFTAIMLTRLMIVTWLRQRRPQALPV